MLLEELDDTVVHFDSASPEKPFLYRGTERQDVESADQRRVQVGQLILCPLVYRCYDAAPFGEFSSSQFAVQAEVHHCLENFGTCAVELVEEQYHRLSVDGKPVGGHEVGSACCLILMGEAEYVPGIAHLAEKQCHYGKTLG